MGETPGHGLRRGGATIWLMLWSHDMGVPIWSRCYGAMLSMGVHMAYVYGAGRLDIIGSMRIQWCSFRLFAVPASYVG